MSPLPQKQSISPNHQDGLQSSCHKPHMYTKTQCHCRPKAAWTHEHLGQQSPPPTLSVTLDSVGLKEMVCVCGGGGLLCFVCLCGDGGWCMGGVLRGLTVPQGAISDPLLVSLVCY